MNNALKMEHKNFQNQQNMLQFGLYSLKIAKLHCFCQYNSHKKLIQNLNIKEKKIMSQYQKKFQNEISYKSCTYDNFLNLLYFIVTYFLNLMAQEEGGAPYQFTPQGGKTGNSSRDYTGQGYAQYPNGDQYNGDYVDGVRQGKGKYVYANGDRYEGDFKNNNKHGIGKLVYKEKGQYYGQWENGVKHGEGTYLYNNKDTYSGWWQFGKKNGKGTYTYSQSNMKLVGEWKQNTITDGRWIFPNGTYFEGKFLNNKPTQNGTWHFNNGNQLQGNYKQTIIPNEDPDDKKLNIKLDWQSNVGISQSAWEVNAHQIF